MKIENRKSIATDRDGFEIRVGDTVKEVQGELRQGTILHIHRAFVFLYNRELNENLGVFAARTTNLATIAAKGARINTGPDLNKMNPAMERKTGGAMPPPPVVRSGGYDKAIGQTVIIRQGPYKGLLGIIKDTTDVTARVELHSNLRTVSIEKTKLTFKTFVRLAFVTNGSAQGNVPYEAFASRGRGSSTGPTPSPSPYHGGRTPGLGDGGRTPAYGGMGSRTPAYRGDGGRTPAWNAGSSNRTPAWSGSGNKTPAWGSSGSKTPAWGNSSARTPAWTSSGNRTPAWGGNREGGRTPARRDDTARTPGAAPWDDAAKVATPGVWNAPTPGVTSF
jgi:transcription elongation factor SPT5